MHPKQLSHAAALWAVGGLAVLATAFTAAQAIDYTVVFGNTTTLAGSINLAPPHGGTDYRQVTSKFNQPRNVTGTNPHRGTDLSSAFGTTVRMMHAGWIVLPNPGAFELDMYLDLNNDGLKNDNAHVRYDHLNSILVSSTTTYLTAGTAVATSGNEGGAYPAHLHFGLRKDLNADGVADVWIRNEPYYRSVIPWDAGRLLDFVSLSTFSANVASVHCYAADENSQNEAVSAGDVTLFHRLAGSATWRATAATKSSNQFTANLKTAGGYATGASVQWMARCYRSSIKGVVTPSWAFHPPKFNQPDADPNVTANTYDFFTNTIS